MRKQCSCGTYFWTTDQHRKVCGDPKCDGGFSFIGKSPAAHKLGYTEVWSKFSHMFKEMNYEAVNRYPVAARWNPTTEFTIASIAAFQPYVVNGESAPPAKKLVIPQFCLRFGDIDNVGITGSHMTGFVMIGQHAFLNPSEWNQEELFRNIYKWLKEGLGLPSNEITFHEDAWAGGGNFGPCMEYFSRGCEIGNQVYMMYEQTPSGAARELKLKVLDMGMGQERNAWFSQGTNNIYSATFPEVCTKLFKTTGHIPDEKLLQKFSIHAANLNVDETENINSEWNQVAAKVGVTSKHLREEVMKGAAIFSIGEHTRALLVALSDGALPSNTGGGYNLRAILRRSLSFIDKYDWKIDLPEICEVHARTLKRQFPELEEAMPEVIEILEVERRKYIENRKKSHSIIRSMLESNREITTEKLIEVYDSNGISPETLADDAKKLGKNVHVPENFYSLVSEKQEKRRAELTENEEKSSMEKSETATGAGEQIDESDITGIHATHADYFNDWKDLSFSAKIVKVVGNKIILDRTKFYPTSGGQVHDTGTIAGEKVVNVYKQRNIIIHELASAHKFPEGEGANCVIDFDRRKLLSQLHTGAHIVNGACRQVLGNHIWQAGAAKTLEKARLDITHYEQISEEQLGQIEKVCAEIIAKNIKVNKQFMERAKAEKAYGFRLYQGGAVPGKQIRVVEIPDFDVEACGGTHVNTTGEVEAIKILRTLKISDSVVRVEFLAGRLVSKTDDANKFVLEQLASELKCSVDQIPGRCEELFQKWKTVVKKKKMVPILELTSVKASGESEEVILKDACRTLSSQPVHVVKTVKRFLKEMEEEQKNIS